MLVRPRFHRRAFSLIEAVMIVVVLAICVPPTLSSMEQSAQERADAIAMARATALAQCVMEHVQADVASESSTLGYEALESASIYLEKPVIGLHARLESLVSPYTSAGLTYSVIIGPPVSSSGSSTGDANLDLFRLVTVSVSAPSARSSTPLAYSIAALVTDL